MKKIVIAGAGDIGSFIAERLTAEKFQVTVMDQNPDVLTQLQNTMDVGVVLGNATNRNDLINSDIGEADLFIATTRQDETNLVACLLAHDIHVPQTVAITRYLGSRHKGHLNNQPLGIDLVINSSEVVKNEIMEVVETTGVGEVARFGEGNIVLVGYQMGGDCHIAGKTVGGFMENGKTPRFFVASLVRKNKLVPVTPETIMENGDYLYLITTNDCLPELNAALRVETIKTRTAVIVGDNFLSQLVADALINRRFQVTLIAQSKEKVRFFENIFRERPDFKVIKGEGTDVRLLREHMQPAPSVFIASQSNDSANMASCMVGKYLGAGKTIGTIRSHDLMPLSNKAGVDVNIAPHMATAKKVQMIVHGDRMVSYRAVTHSDFEVIEVEAMEGCPGTKSPLSRLKLPEGVTIGGILSAGESFLPHPEYTIKKGDKVILLTSPEHLLEVESLFC